MNAAWVSERTISLPLGPALTDEDVEDVIDAVRWVLLGHERVGPVSRTTSRASLTRPTPVARSHAAVKGVLP